MKSAFKYILHKLLGFNNYLFVFSLFKIQTLRLDKKERDFFYFLNLIPENSVVLDIGANIGIMTFHIARTVKNVQVLCFEPIPGNLQALKRIIRYFQLKNVEVFDFALGNKEGRVEMVMPVIDSVKMQGLSHVLHNSISENNVGEQFQVEIKKLDNIERLSTIERRISAIKIDVENFEFFVLEGGRNLMNKNRPIVYAELWENENRDNCFDYFKTLQYKTVVIADGKVVPYHSAVHKTQNFIFLPA